MFEKKIQIYKAEFLKKINIQDLKYSVFPSGFVQSKNWTHQRREEFFLARSMLKKICDENHINLQAKDLHQNGRECIWPKNYKGSISHSRNKKNKDLVIAVILSNEHALTGIDVEFIQRFHNLDLQNSILNKNEKNLIHKLKIVELSHHLKKEHFYLGAIFSAKEALFKALFPICKTYFGFLDAQVQSLCHEKNFIKVNIRLLRKLRLIEKDNYQIEVRYDQNYFSSLLLV